MLIKPWNRVRTSRIHGRRILIWSNSLNLWDAIGIQSIQTNQPAIMTPTTTTPIDTSTHTRTTPAQPCANNHFLVLCLSHRPLTPQCLSHLAIALPHAIACSHLIESTALTTKSITHRIASNHHHNQITLITNR